MIKKIFNLTYHHKLVMSVAKGSMLGVFASNFLSVLVVTYLLFGIIPTSYIVYWMIFNGAIIISRVYITKKFEKQDDSSKDKSFLRITAFFLIISSVSYSFMLFIAVLYGVNDVVMMTLVFPVIGLVSGSISTLGSIYILFLFYNTISFIPLVSILIYHGGGLFAALSFVIITFYLVYIFAGYKYFLTIRNSLSLNDTFKLLYDRSPNGIVLMKDNRFADCNSSILRMFKYDSKKVFLTTHVKNLSPLRQPDGEMSIKKMLRMTSQATFDNVNSFEWIHKNADGNDFWCSVVLTKIYLEGDEYIYGIWQDISANKELEVKQNILLKRVEEINDSLLEKVEIEVKNNRKKDKQLLDQSRFAQMGEMISMIAHQWRQPLAAISSRSIAIELNAQLGILDDKTILENSKYIAQYSQHLSDTIDDFRNFFKENKEKVDFTYSEIVDSVLNIMEASVTNKNIKILKQLDSTQVFNSFQNELKQVIINIIKNAEDVLMEEKIPNAIITIQTDDNKLIIKDNGKGIPEDIIDKIFDPYFSTKMEKNGTGLGLYMSKTIIEEHCNGHLSVQNDEYGAVFEIQLNIKAPSL